MRTLHRDSGFTAVELLVTLFVAAAFLIAAYQLFNLVVKDGGATRSESRAANVAYDYLRQYAASATTIPCTASTPLNNAPLSVDGLTSVTINVIVSCLPNAIASLSKVEVAITYNNPAQTIKYATYTSSAGSSTIADITNGLVAEWKLNGDVNNSVGSPNAVNLNATSTTGQNGLADNAYAFNGSNARINTNSTFGLGATNATISCWIFNPIASNSGQFVRVGSSGYGIGIGNTSSFDNGNNGNRLIMLYENVRWIVTSTTIGTGWHHIVMVIDGSGVPTGYVDGVSSGAYPGAGPLTPNLNLSFIGGNGGNARYFNGSIDDVRLYNRALPQADILKLYSNGAQ